MIYTVCTTFPTNNRYIVCRSRTFSLDQYLSHSTAGDHLTEEFLVLTEYLQKLWMCGHLPCPIRGAHCYAITFGRIMCALTFTGVHMQVSI
uniref:Uncharacterized protein n=1 Tax=Pseudomonas fluorescens (strain SBW25) TaxID=216595 RepID=A4V7P7_PSEFS|nr:hypothetical protein pQBR0138 [Pseudomonas fluorescens SBW25]